MSKSIPNMKRINFPKNMPAIYNRGLRCVFDTFSFIKLRYWLELVENVNNIPFLSKQIKNCGCSHDFLALALALAALA